MKKGSVSCMKTGVHKSLWGFPSTAGKAQSILGRGEATLAAHNSEIEGGDLQALPVFHVRAPASDLSAAA